MPCRGRAAAPRPGTRALVFRYTGLSLLAPERSRFRYRLDGFDDDWMDAGTQREASYTHLPPGATASA